MTSKANQGREPMNTTPTNNGRVVVACALAGLALVGTGLVLAVLSNPKRFSINIADDRNIQLFALSGFVSTLVGILLFLYAVRNTTKSMPAQLQTKANIGVGLGFLLQLAGVFSPEILRVRFELGIALILGGLLAFVWGATHYAQGKGYSRSLGWYAILGIPGLIVLVLLPHRDPDRSVP